MTVMPICPSDRKNIHSQFYMEERCQGASTESSKRQSQQRPRRSAEHVATATLVLFMVSLTSNKGNRCSRRRKAKVAVKNDECPTKSLKSSHLPYDNFPFGQVLDSLMGLWSFSTSARNYFEIQFTFNTVNNLKMPYIRNFGGNANK